MIGDVERWMVKRRGKKKKGTKREGDVKVNKEAWRRRAFLSGRHFGTFLIGG